MGKRRVVGMVKEGFLVELRLIHKREVEAADLADRAEPAWSNTVEMLLRKGVKAYRAEVQVRQ